MLRIVVCVSGGGTNLQAILDAIDGGTVTNTRVLAAGTRKSKRNRGKSDFAERVRRQRGF